MSFKKVTKKEWIKMGLPVSITHIGPFYEYDRKKTKKRNSKSTVKLNKTIKRKKKQ